METKAHKQILKIVMIPFKTKKMLYEELKISTNNTGGIEIVCIWLV